MAQTPAVTPASTLEKLYISLENTDSLAVVDLKAFKHTKTLKVGMHPHGQASPASQDKLYVAAEIGGTVTLSTPCVTRSSRHSTWVLASSRRTARSRRTGAFSISPRMPATGRYSIRRKKQIVEYIHTLGIGHNTVMAPDGRFAYLLPIAGGPGHFARQSLGLPRTQPKEVTVVDAQAHKVVGTIPVGSGPRPGTISPDGKRLYMNVDDLLGFLVIDTAARKVISKATYTLTPDEQAVRSRSHGIAVANDGKEVWSNDVVHNLTFVFDVTVNPPKQIARFAVGRQPYWIMASKDSKTIYVNCPSSDELIAFDVAAKKEKGRIQFPKGSRPTRMLTVAAPTSPLRTSR